MDDKIGDVKIANDIRKRDYFISNVIENHLVSDKGIVQNDVTKTMNSQINLSNWSIREKDSFLPPIR